MSSYSVSEKAAFEIRYLVMPSFVFKNDRLTFLSAKIYAFIHNYRYEQFFFSNEKLAELFNCHETSISKAISLLKTEGYITTEQPDGGKRYITDVYSNLDDIRPTREGVSLKANPPLASRPTPPPDRGLAYTPTLNPPNQAPHQIENAEFGVPNKNIYNKNIYKNFFGKTSSHSKTPSVTEGETPQAQVDSQTIGNNLDDESEVAKLRDTRKLKKIKKKSFNQPQNFKQPQNYKFYKKRGGGVILHDLE